MADRLHHLSVPVRSLLNALSVADKANLIMGEGIWTTRAIQPDTAAGGHHGVPPIVVTDGPNGARGGGLMGTGTPTACIPAGSVLGATWDPDLVERLGQLLGDECVAKAAQVLLAPTINLHRNPLGGRNFECFSEDPFLTGRLASCLIRGVQSRGVVTTPKHFVANDSEFERNTIDVQADERTLREVYLAPFEHAVRDGDTGGLMTAYNRLNGTFCGENAWLLQTVLRDQWGYTGFVVSDWFGTRSTGASIRAGLSLEMPGPGSWFGEDRVLAALDAGEIDEAHLDAIAGDMLKLIERTSGLGAEAAGVGLDEDAAQSAEKTLDRVEDRALIREAAAAGSVLITNDGVLPLDIAAVGSIAVIGPNAKSARIMGGGSANVRPYRSISPLAALEQRAGEQVTITYAQGCDISRSVVPIAAPLLDGTMTIELFRGHDQSGDAVETSQSDRAAFMYFGAPAPGIDAQAFSLTARGTIVPPVDGSYLLRLEQNGRTRVSLDGQLTIDATGDDIAGGDSFFGFGSAEIAVPVDCKAGQPIELLIEYDSKGAVLLAGSRVGLTPVVPVDLLTEAEATAAAADVAIVVVGTNDDWETEGRDRDLFDLPGEQDELIRRVAAVNGRTIVVVNTGGPHGMDWLDEPNAVLNSGFGGQELGDAIVDVLVGDVDPGGRMPTTIPMRYEHSPGYLNYPGENSIVRYGEGLFIGHRFFDARHIEPRVPFGHGLSYTTFAWSAPRVPTSAPTSLTSALQVEIDVTNTGGRAGADVVQIYVEPPPASVQRPVRELKGFAKVQLAPGESQTATVDLDRRAFAYFDPGDPDFAELSKAGPVPAKGGGDRHVEPGWYVEPGVYRLVIARSSVDHVHVVEIELTGEVSRTDA